MGLQRIPELIRGQILFMQGIKGLTKVQLSQLLGNSSSAFNTKFLQAYFSTAEVTLDLPAKNNFSSTAATGEARRTLPKSHDDHGIFDDRRNTPLVPTHQKLHFYAVPIPG